ncbi:MAG: amino acid--tRNA ligase-related protein [Patescibacteria group bacterium]
MQRIFIKDLKDHVGQEVSVSGWVSIVRDQGKMVFFDFRDMSGTVQGVVLSDKKDLVERAKPIRSDWVVRVEGKVNKRPDKMVNEKVQNGDIELEITNIQVLNESKTSPFDVLTDTSNIDEETRLKYRYIDLRSERMQKNMRLRSEWVNKCRGYLLRNSFTEIETPILTESTPEGSRDFVVPSRLNPGKFYALPQSPQQYKQLLMVAGFERYFQIARAVRDEDLRADRGFEHTQIDIETSFLKQDELLDLLEAMFIEVAESLGHKIKQKPFPRITYKEAMQKYGADKFDMRTEEEKGDGKTLAYAWVVDFPFFEKTDQGDWTFTHNPFSMPKEECLEDHLTGKNIENIITQQYDLVCNGYESAGGSIRAHDPKILEATYKIMGYSDEKIQKSVGHMLEALKYGAPPHGGIAIGVERNIMNLANEAYLREVQAFPMTRGGKTSVMNAPSELSLKQLKELGISIKK